ncbi:hypothetical protein SRHO_G00320960 [Serrasalmus rhombeus]
MVEGGVSKSVVSCQWAAVLSPNWREGNKKTARTSLTVSGVSESRQREPAAVSLSTQVEKREENHLLAPGWATQCCTNIRFKSLGASEPSRDPSEQAKVEASRPVSHQDYSESSPLRQYNRDEIHDLDVQWHSMPMKQD